MILSVRGANLPALLPFALEAGVPIILATRKAYIALPFLIVRALAAIILIRSEGR